MLTTIIAYLTRIFNQTGSVTYGSELERYIVSKGPQSVAEIDHWTKQFDKNQAGKGWL